VQVLDAPFRVSTSYATHIPSPYRGGVGGKHGTRNNKGGASIIEGWDANTNVCI
jgi:hypothetical protein